MKAVVDMRTRTKRCSICRKRKPLNEKYFVRHSRSRRGFASACKVCKKAQRPNRRPEYARIKQRRKELFEFVARLKEESPCMDCGEYFPYFVMEYDHRDPASKELNIAKFCNNGYSIKRILSEIKKCDLVCSNCHRIRTWGYLYD